MQAPPWTIIVYVAKWVTIVVAGLIMASDNLVLVSVAVILAVALVGLLRGNRVAWVLLIVLEVGAVGSTPFDDSPWWVLPLSVVALALLIARPTRAHLAS